LIHASQKQLRVNDSSLSREPGLDAIRGIAVGLVVLFHYFDERSGIATTRGPMWLVDYIARFGWAGVQLFFVLSGFLIGGILIRNRSSEGYFRTFYLRRFVRIVPLYVAALLVFGLFYSSCDWRAAKLESVFRIDVPVWSLLTLTQNFFIAFKGDWLGPGWLAVTWSLCVEEQFYLLLPILIFLLPIRRIPAVCVAAILAAPLFRAVLMTLWPGNLVAPYVLLPGRMDALFFGVLGAWLWNDDQARDFIVRWRPLIMGSFVIMTAMLLTNLPRIGPFGHKTEMIGFTVIAAYFFVGIMLAVSSSKVPAYLSAARKPLRLAGLGAYSIYLFHRPIQTLVRVALPAHPVFTVLASTLLTAAFALACWRWIEAPAIRYGRRAFHYGRRGSNRCIATTW
jgi:peptidoglycan/LPS O-acetylase OafA/YrhL